jgi:hypothetical protein
LKQTMLALQSGEQLAEHDAPGAATLHVLRGHIQIPPMRHRLERLADAVVLLTVATAQPG